MTPAAGLVEGRRRGLSTASADALLAEHGPNILVPEGLRQHFILKLVKPLADPMALLLMLASATYFFLGDRSDAIITIVALVPVILVGAILEGRAERALDRLRRLASPTASVWRDGDLVGLPTRSIVPGDEVFVREGDVIPADGCLIDGAGIVIDESSLTGESLPVEKHADLSGDDERLLAGTTVLSGRGTFVVDVTGLRTRYGAIGRLMASVKPPPTPMQQRIDRLVRRLGLGAAVICLVVTGVEAWRGHSFAGGVIAGVSLAMAAIPEEFPMIYALYLALGAWRLARDNALVRRLSSVETLGSTTVICTDKTGTLTTGRVEAVEDRVAAGATEKSLWEAAVRACEPQPFDPLDQAIVRAAPTRGLDPAAADGESVVRSYPFDPSTKTVVRVTRAGSRFISSAKGAIEGILEIAHAAPTVRADAVAENERLAASGMRVLAVASGDAPLDAASRSGDEKGLEYLGLIAFSDPVRDGVAQTLDECKTAGIKVLIVTGDHPSTAAAVAKRLGFRGDEDVMTGTAIDTAGDDTLARMTAESAIFARTRPEQKHRLVTLLQSRGEVVAMTGDGTNDAPALREADIGIAMGRRGTEVARESADLILMDDDFSTIVRAIRDGRRIFDNLQRAFAYLVAFHMPLLLSAFALPLIGAPLLLLPVHFVWLELIVHPTSSLVFEADSGAPDLMRRAPRKRNADLLPADTLIRAATDGGVLAAAVLVLYLELLANGFALDVARGEAIAAMIVGQTVLILLERRPGAFLWRAASGATVVLPVVAAVTLASLWAALHLPAIAAILQVAPLSASGWLVASAVGVAATVWREPLKALRMLSRPRNSPSPA
jgi:P-type Ca2+ transporter type 2C